MKVLLECDGSREGGEDGQHPQLQAVVRAAQGTLTQRLPRRNTLDDLDILKPILRRSDSAAVTLPECSL